MSHEQDKLRHSRRRHNTETVIEKRRRYLKTVSGNAWYDVAFKYKRHRLAKWNGINCGNPNCFMCMNPRKYGEKTIQELSFEQTEKWVDDEDNNCGE